MNYYFHPAAEAEHLEMVGYYESKRPGLGASYLVEFENIMSDVCKSPRRCPIDQKPDIRRRRMMKFPFTVLYREMTGSIQILSVAHHRRRPAYWLGRLYQDNKLGRIKASRLLQARYFVVSTVYIPSLSHAPVIVGVMIRRKPQHYEKNSKG